jgi:hypothetical protein
VTSRPWLGRQLGAEFVGSVLLATIVVAPVSLRETELALNCETDRDKQ